MKNSFFDQSLDKDRIRRRLLEIESGKVGFYSVGLYPASLAYNCAMQTNGDNLLLAPRPGRDLLGAFDAQTLEGMDQVHVKSIFRMATHKENHKVVTNNLSDLILRCEIVVLSANSNHILDDLQECLDLRRKLNRNNVVIACLAGSFCNDAKTNDSYVLCEREPNLGFFSGFHRHGSLRNPLDSFTANFCHPDALTALLGARLLDKLSPNLQVSSGVHNIEAQYIKAAKNIASIFAGFGHEYHKDNPGLLPTLLTLLLDQCLDQAATVSMIRPKRDELYSNQPFALTELGYGVQRIEAALGREGELEKVRDHTFAQLTAMVADVRGSMMLPISGNPTRNFQAGQVLAKRMKALGRCPHDLDEMFHWCQSADLNTGGLEGLKSLMFWPNIQKRYLIPGHDSSMVNLLYHCIFGDKDKKHLIFNVMTQSRELTSYCQESVRPTHSRRYAEALNNLDKSHAVDLIVNTVIISNLSFTLGYELANTEQFESSKLPIYLETMNLIEQNF